MEKTDIVVLEDPRPGEGGGRMLQQDWYLAEPDHKLWACEDKTMIADQQRIFWTNKSVPSPSSDDLRKRSN